MDEENLSFSSMQIADVLKQLDSNTEGLTSSEASKRLKTYGANEVKKTKKYDSATLLMNQFRSPLVLILIAAALLSLFLGDTTDAAVILVIVLVSSMLGFWQEKRASIDVGKLLALVKPRTTILRDNKAVDIYIENVVPGDIVILNAGDYIPGDCLILESNDLFADEAVLTGESYPVEKYPCIMPHDTSATHMTNSLYMGTHIVSGTAHALVVHTGKNTKFGKIAEELGLKPRDTEFEKGIKKFGYMLMQITLILIAAIFVANMLMARSMLESLIFSLAIAIGLTPQLLPAIISINLAKGASHMAKHKVIVKRLNSIEDFGSMNILCSDKTGTLTEGRVRLHSAIDLNNKESDKLMLYAYLNAFYETGFTNPIDEAIRTRHVNTKGYEKTHEIPYDFTRKRLSIAVRSSDGHMLITKGAVDKILEICSSAEIADSTVDIESVRSSIEKKFEEFSLEGFRVLGVAYKKLETQHTTAKGDENEMTFLGFIILDDPPKKDVAQVIEKLNTLGVSLRIITGDNRFVAAHVMKEIGIQEISMLTGSEIGQMSDEELAKRSKDVDLFAEIEPKQKERIVKSLQRAGNTVGYMGDGINDAPALHAADVGISVDSGVEVAKKAADIVLLEKGLDVLANGVEEGRRTFANTIKYVHMATSANFGNMLSMAGASIFLPFIPLLPKQVMLTNFITDVPEMTIATDSVDRELTEKPKEWDIKFVGNFMLLFGAISSIFDYITFAVLFFVLEVPMDVFRTGWFTESVLSASLIVLVIRTRRPFFKSKPSKWLLAATLLVCAFVLALPYTSLGKIFGFSPLPLFFMAIIVIILFVYIAMVEIAKKLFYKD